MNKIIAIFLLFTTLQCPVVYSQHSQEYKRDDNAGYYLLKNADLYFSKGKLLVAKEIYIDNIQFLNEQQKINLSSILVMNQENADEKSLVFKLVKDIADQNNPSVKAYLGKLYMGGIGTQRDSVRGAMLLDESVAANNSDGYFYKAWVLRGRKEYDRSFDFFKRAADMGNAMAMNNLGQIYNWGIGKPVNYDSALYWYQKGAALGNGLAYANIGLMYYSGVGVEKDYKKAFDYLTLSNNNGNINYTQLNTIGLCYLNGKGVDANADSAFQYFYAAGIHGNPSGYTNIGVLYEYFKGEKKATRDSAVYFYSLGLHHNDVDACAYLGRYFLKNAHINPKGYELAANYFEIGASFGNTSCMVQYANLIKMGKVKENDSFKYLPLLENASLLGSSEADNLLGLAFDSLHNDSESKKYFSLGISRNNFNALVNYCVILKQKNPSDSLIEQYLVRAVKLGKSDGVIDVYETFPEYKKFYDPYAKPVFEEVYNGAQNGNLNLQKTLTSFYYLGIGTPADKQKAIQNGIEVYNKDSLNANFIGFLYSKKDTADYSNAFKWYTIAVRKKEEQYPEATANIANLYANGLGTTRDTIKAMEYYLKSAEAGNIFSMAAVGYAYSPWGDHLAKTDSAKAFHWIEKSALLGNPVALNNLGECYYTGLGTKKDFEKARYYYQLSADKGEPIGKTSLGVLYLNGEGVAKDIPKAKALFEEGCKGDIQEACDKLKELK